MAADTALCQQHWLCCLCGTARQTMWILAAEQAHLKHAVLASLPFDGCVIVHGHNLRWVQDGWSKMLRQIGFCLHTTHGAFASCHCFCNARSHMLRDRAEPRPEPLLGKTSLTRCYNLLRDRDLHGPMRRVGLWLDACSAVAWHSESCREEGCAVYTLKKRGPAGTGTVPVQLSPSDHSNAAPTAGCHSPSDG